MHAQLALNIRYMREHTCLNMCLCAYATKRRRLHSLHFRLLGAGAGAGYAFACATSCIVSANESLSSLRHNAKLVNKAAGCESAVVCLRLQCSFTLRTFICTRLHTYCLLWCSRITFGAAALPLVQPHYLWLK